MARRTVNLEAVDRIVSVGRGTKEKENIPMVQKLLDVLHAEMAIQYAVDMRGNSDGGCDAVVPARVEEFRRTVGPLISDDPK